MEIIRATKTAHQAGAYYVRIQAMARKHQIPLDVEFDEHDTPETKYIVIVDDYLPIATCRLYAIDDTKVMLGRVVVLPEYLLEENSRRDIHLFQNGEETLRSNKVWTILGHSQRNADVYRAVFVRKSRSQWEWVLGEHQQKNR